MFPDPTEAPVGDVQTEGENSCAFCVLLTLEAKQGLEVVVRAIVGVKAKTAHCQRSGRRGEDCDLCAE